MWTALLTVHSNVKSFLEKESAGTLLVLGPWLLWGEIQRHISFKAVSVLHQASSQRAKQHTHNSVLARLPAEGAPDLEHLVVTVIIVILCIYTVLYFDPFTYQQKVGADPLDLMREEFTCPRSPNKPG